MKPSVAVAWMCFAWLFAGSPRAYADDADGVYGRVDGDLGLEVGAGAALASRSGAALFTFAARYLQTAGLYATWLDDFRAGTRPASRAASLGVELRPVFLARWSKNLEHGPAFTDLTLDSFALRLGAVVSRNPGYEFGAPGFEAGIGWGIPLTSSAHGPWLQATAMLRLSQQAIAWGADQSTDRFAIFALSFAWQSIVDMHLIDAGDRLQR